MNHDHDIACQKTESFRMTMMEILDRSSLALLISIGHRTGLFDTMSRMTPATAREIATTARLDAHCVREWLDALALGGIVEYDPEGPLYFLPSAHAALLTRLAPDDNLAALAQSIVAAGALEDDLVACFATGARVLPTRARRLHEVMAEEREQAIVDTLFERILPLAPGLMNDLAREAA